jgi:hypothetical protein
MSPLESPITLHRRGQLAARLAHPTRFGLSTRPRRHGGAIGSGTAVRLPARCVRGNGLD